MRCQYCDEELKFEKGRGWVHMEGGLYKQYCPMCGWRGRLSRLPRIVLFADMEK